MAKKAAHKNQLPSAQAMPIALALAAFVVLSFLAQYVFPAKGAQQASAPLSEAEGRVLINEVMSANASAIVDDNGRYSDWIELVNGSGEAVSLRGWTLNRAAQETLPFTFPDMEILPGEHLLIFADGRARSAAGYALHTPWKLAAAGDTLTLLAASGVEVDRVVVPPLEKNESYARAASGEWAQTAQYTPGLSNTADSFAQIMAQRSAVLSDVVISEVMIKNRTYVPDEDGEYSDYIELHNTSSRSISLNGYSLSDTDANLGKWTLPPVTIAPDGYLLVYASGKNRTGETLHTNFKLGEGEGVFLSNSAGLLADCVTPETTGADQAFSRLDTGFSASFPPTPGQPNTDEGVARVDAQLTAGNTYGLYLSEVMASTTQTDLSPSSHDWVEIYNSSAGTVDISGFGLSDNANRPRKWQFPSGTTIGAGEYKIIFLSGTDGVENGTPCASFRLSREGGYSLILSDPEGRLVDRLPMSEQYSNMSFGRSYSVSGLRYYTDPTPRAANLSQGTAGRAQEAVFSVPGGLFDAGQTVTLTLSAPAGSTIHYTTDFSDPTEASPVYAGPITMSQTTIVRCAVYHPDKLPSLITTHSYFFGLSHTLPVVSLVSDNKNLFDYNEGIFEMGPGAVGEYSTPPYGSNNKGANFWMDWEKDAHVELFAADGETILSQGCGLKLQGQYSRAEDQKALKLIARSKYGDNRFRVPLFDERPYTEYQSFILRASGQDWDKTRMRDAVQTALADETDVMHQATRMCVVYINGQYWGHYNMRERINKYSMAQWEGWSSDVDKIDIIKGNRTVMHGSNETFATLLEWLKKNDISTQEDIDHVASVVDIDNYLDYVAVEIYIGNPDLLNVKRYRSSEEDGLWRWVLFDTDWGFYTDTNSMRRWLDPRGAGSEYKTDNTLFVKLMANAAIRDKFLRRFDELMVRSWTADKVLSIIEDYYRQLTPEIDQHLTRWNIARSRFDSSMEDLIEYAQERPLKMLHYVIETYDLTDQQISDYFGRSLSIVVPQAIEDIARKIESSGKGSLLNEWRLDEAEYDRRLASLKEYASTHYASRSLIARLYAVYEPNGGPRNELALFGNVLNEDAR